MTPLHLAARHGHFSIFEYLVNHKALINENANNVDFLNLIILPFI